MFYLFKMPKRRIFGHFLTSSEDKLFSIKKEDMSSKKRTYVTLYYDKLLSYHAVAFRDVD